MRFLHQYLLLPAALGLAAVPHIAAAQEAPLYAPLMMAFDGKDALGPIRGQRARAWRRC